MKSKGRQFAGSCSSNPPNLHQRRTTLLPSADRGETMPKDCEPVRASVCYSGTMGHSPQPQDKALGANCASAPHPRFLFHLLPLQICCLGTASARLQMVSLVTGGKHCSLSYWYPKASRPAVIDCFILKNKHCLAPWARSLSPALTSDLFTL